MTITARYPGICTKCGRAFKAGDQINWTKGVGSEHAKCTAATKPTSSPSKPTPVPVSAEPAPISKTFSRRSKYDGPEVGWTFRARDGQILTVVRVSSQYMSASWCEDNDDFTFSGDPYYLFTAACRLATDEEAAPVLAAIAAAEAKKTAKAGLEAIAGLVRKVENSVTGSAGQYPTVEGVESVSVQLSNIERLVVSGSGIWVHESTYDDSYSWRIAYDETIATEIRALAALLNK